MIAALALNAAMAVAQYTAVMARPCPTQYRLSLPSEDMQSTCIGSHGLLRSPHNGIGCDAELFVDVANLA